MGMSCSSVCARVCVCVIAYVCACARVHVCNNRLHRSKILAKIKTCQKMTFIDFDVCNLAATLPVLYSVTLTYLSRSNISNVNISKTVRAGEKVQVRSLYRLIFAIEMDHFECCTPWPFPKFSRSNFLTLLFWQVNAWKMQALPFSSDRMSGILQSNGATANAVHHDIDLHFKVMKFELWISRKRWKLTKHAQVWLYTGCYFPSNGTIANVVLRGFDLFFQGHILNANISEMVN